ncbi:hypothetical protein T484DRAFT_1856860, partial [Baffinella frigidus]
MSLRVAYRRVASGLFGSEDSDIVAFGAKTVLFEMEEGNVDEFRQKLLGACSAISLSGWEPERLTQMCIFA